MHLLNTFICSCTNEKKISPKEIGKQMITAQSMIKQTLERKGDMCMGTFSVSEVAVNVWKLISPLCYVPYIDLLPCILML